MDFEKNEGARGEKHLNSTDFKLVILFTNFLMPRLKSVAEARTQQLGPNHPDTVNTKGNLGFLLQTMAKAAKQNGACAEAAGLYRAAAGAYEPKYGKDDVDVVQCRAKARELGV